MSPLVSIVTPTWNSERFLAETIESVLAQSFADWELLLVDDASTDRTPEIARRFAARDRRVRPFRLGRRSGPGAARNLALDEARGRWIAFLDSDDLWLPDKLAHQLAFAEANRSDFCYSFFDFVDENGTFVRRVETPLRATWRSIIGHCYIRTSTVIYDRSVLGRRRMPDIPKRQDFAFWLGLLRDTEAACLPEVTCRARVRAGSVSANKLLAGYWQWRVYRDIERLSLPRSLGYLSLWAVGGIGKYGRFLIDRLRSAKDATA